MKVEIRKNSVVLDGYVNVPSRDSRELPSPRGRFIEQIKPQVFQRALDRAENVDLLFNHKADRKLGSTSEGNLTIYEDPVGLRAICTVTDPEVMEKAKRNELRGWSFGFICREDHWTEQGGVQRRFVEDLDLLEVSILDVTPAYYSTTIEARGGQTVITEQRFEEVEMTLEEIEEIADPSSEQADQIIYETSTTTTVNETVKNVGNDHVVETVKQTVTETPDFSRYEMEIEILKIKGGLN